ncbi:MAG: PD-(D/E)XK nuclease family protein [Candidatus Peribacteria bacterium]|nr:MAG: PD-(D/E)XK nuclease family protein [Candidatus Peribacteria bacterium]
MHDTLEWLYRRVSFQTIPTQAQVVQQYEEQWAKQLEGVQDELDTEQLAEYRQRGLSYIDWYYAKYQPFDKNIPMEMEKNIHFTIGDGHKMRGKIDRLDIDGHDLTIVDYKTSRKRADDKHDEYRAQITLYAKGLQEQYGTKLKKLYGKVVYLHLHNEVEREITPEAIDAIEQEYMDIITQIEQKKAKWADVQ